MSDIYIKGEYIISTELEKVDFDAVCRLLSKSYWAADRPREIIERSIRNSQSYSVFKGSLQIGFARVVTDYATYAYICDLIIDEEFRGEGLGKWLVECILNNPDTQSIKRWRLTTKDAHDLYRKFGFKDLQHPEMQMMLVKE